MEIDVGGTPFYLSGGSESGSVQATIRELTERVDALRTGGKLTNATLLEYYGEKRFEQIAESNALEGSTLSVGETELAVLKGITISGHDPAYSKDAQALAKALEQLTVMARQKAPTDIEQVKALHELILGDRPSAGAFRTTEVRISGSKHVPPRTWGEIMSKMEDWERWSLANASAPALLRAVVLHAWLEHIHPFIDGNGRTGRAITNLELVRAGFPPVILRKEKDRDRYLDALGQADQGELGPFVEIVAGRMEDALRDLERAAQRRQGYDAQRAKLLRAQASRLAVWNAGVHLLFESIKSKLSERFADTNTEFDMHEFNQLSVEDFIDLCEDRNVRLSWAFTIRCRTPGVPMVERLAWAGFAEEPIRGKLAHEASRPVLMWSIRNPSGTYPQWIRAGAASPGGEQMTIHKDRWLVARGGKVSVRSPSDLATQIAEEIADKTIPESTL